MQTVTQMNYITWNCIGMLHVLWNIAKHRIEEMYLAVPLKSGLVRLAGLARLMVHPAVILA